jgi:hypothetical protein
MTMPTLTEVELRGLRNFLTRMGNTMDEGLFCSRQLDNELKAFLLAHGFVSEDVAVRQPEDRARWLAHIAELVDKARRILSDPAADWRRALVILREAEEYDQHMNETKLWVTERGMQLVQADGVRFQPITEFTRLW